MKKRFFAAFMSVVMMLSLLPASVVPVFAAPVAMDDTGIEMHLFNYDENINTSTGRSGWLHFMQAIDAYGPAVDGQVNGLGENIPVMSQVLGSDGYPEVSGYYKASENGSSDETIYTKETGDSASVHRGSLKYLFDKNGVASGVTHYTVSPGDGTKSTGLFQKDSGSGYFYNSANNAAYFNGTNFELYDFTVHPEYEDVTESTNGNFLPFNRVDNDTATRVNNLDKYNLKEGLVDLWFGMSTEFNFYMPEGGKLEGTNKDMIFEFTGDDDVWVYIDGVLVLDISGTHGALSGTINFATGHVEYRNTTNQKTGAAFEKTLKELYEDAGKDVDDIFEGEIFKADSKHTFDFYYLERGGNISTCQLDFNLVPVPKSELSVEKVEANLNDAFKGQQTYTFALKDASGNAMAGEPYEVRSAGGGQVSQNAVTDTNGQFTLKGGQKAVFTNLTVEDKCVVSEVTPSSPGYIVNNDKGTSDSTNELDLDDHQHVVFTNTWTTEDLVISKDVLPPTGVAPVAYDYDFMLNFGNTPYDGAATFRGSSASAIDNGSFTLQDGQTVTIPDVPVGTTFSITEARPNITIYDYKAPNYKLNPDAAADAEGDGTAGDVADGQDIAFGSHFQGTIASGENRVVVTNSFDVATASLTVTKTEKGQNDANLSPEFAGDTPYTFQLVDESGEGIAGQTYMINGISEQTGNDGKFTLYGGQSAVFEGLNVLNQYKVIEEVPANSSYKASPCDSGVISLTNLTNGNQKEDKAISFTNTWSADGTLNGAEELKVTKALSGRDWKAGDSFTFTLTGEDGAPMPAVSEQTVTITATGKLDEDETLSGSFGSISYDETDIGETYVYTITEEPTTIAGIANNTTVYQVFVEISDAGSKNLNVNATYKKGNNVYDYDTKDSLEFTNTYSAEGKVAGWAVSKTIENRTNWVKNDKFEFTLYEEQQVIDTIIIDSDTPGYTKEFSGINYTLADVGTHTYTIKETSSPAGVGITKDPTVYTVTVEVSDTGNGTLAVEATYGDYPYKEKGSFEFVNEYASTGELGAAELKVAKEIQNRTEWVKSDKFEFTLFDKDGVALNTITIEKGDCDHSKCFDSINYTLADVGTHTYTIKETSSPADVGITADDTVYTVTVKVSDDSDGTLVVEPTYKKGTATYTYNDTDGMVFTNVYEADGKLIGAEDLVVSKTINDRADKDWQDSDLYTFTLTGKDNAPMPAVKQITIGKDTENHTKNFGDIVFDESDIGKTYEYTIEEVAKNGKGITTDTTVYTVLVTVTDDGDGTLTVTPVYKIGEEAYTADAMVFTNEYDATGSLDGSKNLKVTKTLTGRSWQETDAFYVEITPKGSDSPMPAGDTVLKFTNTDVAKDSVSAAFGNIAYTEKDIGTHVYEVKEVYGYLTDYGQISRITYDTTVYTVSVTVTDKYDGTLDVTASYVSNRGGWFAKDETYTYGNDGLTFVNRYTKPSKPSTDTDIEDDIPLNTEDHYAYIIGYPDGEVKPGHDITRAEVSTIFFRLLTDEARDLFWATENDYPDVKQGQWFNNAISTLTNAGIINGYDDGTFRPNEPITRAEFAKIAVSFFSYVDKEYQGLYPDVPANKWYALFVEAASELGLIEGYPDGTFRPNEDITRAEACTIVNRTIQRKPHEDQLHQDMIVWPDNPAPGEDGHMWYYEQIQEASNSHDYDFKNEYESWTEILENRDWAALEKAWADSNDAPGGEVMK